MSVDLVDNARLLVSELVTNALLHARTEIGFSVTIDTDRAKVQVADASSRMRCPARAAITAQRLPARGSRWSRRWPPAGRLPPGAGQGRPVHPLAGASGRPRSGGRGLAQLQRHSGVGRADWTGAGSRRSGNRGRAEQPGTDRRRSHCSGAELRGAQAGRELERRPGRGRVGQPEQEKQPRQADRPRPSGAPEHGPRAGSDPATRRRTRTEPVAAARRTALLPARHAQGVAGRWLLGRR